MAYQVDDLAFSPDGKLLTAISHYSGPYRNAPFLAHIWKTSNWTLVNTVEDGSGSMTGLVWDSAGRSFITSRAEMDKNDRTMYAWYASGRAAMALVAPPVSALALDDRDRWLFAAVDNGYILRYRFGDGQLLDRFHVDGDAVTRMAALPEGSGLLAGGTGGRITRWDLSVTPPIPQDLDVADYSSGLSLLADGTLMAYCTKDGHTVVQQPVPASGMQIITLQAACVWTKFSPDQRWLAVSGADGVVRLLPLDPAAKPSIPLLPAPLDVEVPADTSVSIQSLPLPDMSGNGLRATTVTRLAVVRTGLDTNALVEAYGEELPSTFAAHARYGRLLAAFHLPTGARAEYKKDALIVEYDNGKPSVTLPGDGSKLHTAVFSPDGSLVATGAVDGGVRLWSLPDGAKQCEIFRNPIQVKAVQFNGQGSLLAVGYDDLTIEVYSVPNCQRVYRLPATTRHINDLEFSPDDTLLVSAAADTSAQVFELSTGRLLDRLEPDHAKKGLHALAIHPGQVILAVGSYEGVLTLFNLRTGEFLARYRTGSTGNPITDLAFSMGGDKLFVLLADETWVVYEAQN